MTQNTAQHNHYISYLDSKPDHMSLRQQPPKLQQDMVSGQQSHMLEIGPCTHSIAGFNCSSGIGLLCWDRAHCRRLLLRSLIAPLPSFRYHTVNLLDWPPPLAMALWTTSTISCHPLSVHQTQSSLR